MAKTRLIHRCTDCGAVHPRWVGRCGTCGSWGSLVEEVERPGPPERGPTGGGTGAPARPVMLAGVDAADWAPRTTGVDELDRVLGGGLVPGSVTLLGGEPGIGKSTLVLQVLAAVAARGSRTLLVSAEESPQQVRLRAERLGALVPGLWLVAETSMDGVLQAVAEVGPEVVVVDSVQTVADPEIGSAPGSVVQVRECASRLVRTAKDGNGTSGPAIVLVGHVTKDGSLAGPRLLEHVVDTVLSFEGERHHALRLLRATKHRFGPTGELGLFEMGGSGLAGVPDASGILLGDRRPGVAGGVVVPAMEGRRPLLVELQALVVRSGLAMPRRSAQGLDSGRLALLLAVLERWAGLTLSAADVFASVVGGVRVVEPAADLALVLALASAAAGSPLPHDLVACGEVGLSGEVRQVAQVQRRLAEAARLGFARAVVPQSSPPGPPDLELVRVATVVEALSALHVPIVSIRRERAAGTSGDQASVTGAPGAPGAHGSDWPAA
ncbi:MAG: DNA repair protein RadA [Acidimicrobiales bacterium]